MNNSIKFTDISNVNELIAYLENKVKGESTQKKDKIRYVYHYTNIKSVIGILQTKFWHLNLPDNMNDGLEVQNSCQNKRNNFFFSSFMLDSTESIAMWSMYAQPWIDGIMIRIPVESFKKWTKSKFTVCVVENKKVILDRDITELSSLKSYAVVYCLEGKNHDELYCGGGKNVKLKGVKYNKKTSGYVKDYSWNYEKEIRLRVDLNTPKSYDKIAISIPDDVLDSIEFVTGPRFEADLLSRIHKEADPKFEKSRIEASKFTGHLKWVYCDNCLKKRLDSKY
jgi:hypothetical protein